MKTYKNYNIETGGLGFLYVHKDYDGVTYLGEDIEHADPRCGSAQTIEQVKEEIDEIEESLAEKRSERTLAKSTTSTTQKVVNLNPCLAATVAGAQDFLMDGLMKRKTRIEASTILTVHDHYGRAIDIYYRVIEDCPISNQSDDTMDAYSIEQVLYLGRKVNLSGRGEQELLTYLNCKNPEGIVYPF